MEWYLKVVRDNYANFEGRARRKEYWMFVLYNALFGFALYMIVLLGLMAENSLLMGIGTALLVIYAVAIFIPSLAVCIRRLHDTNNSGWMYLIQFIPLIGVFWLLYLFVKEGAKVPTSMAQILRKKMATLLPTNGQVNLAIHKIPNRTITIHSKWMQNIKKPEIN